MKVTFPHMGPVRIYQKLFEMLGNEVIPPPAPTQRTIELGVKYSPEFICFPFKIILGSYLEAIEHGAEVIVTSGGIGACRAVYYGDLSEKILSQMGHQVKVIVFDSVFDDIGRFWRDLQTLRNGKSLFEVYQALRLCIQLVYANDRYQKKLISLLPHETVPGSCHRQWLAIRELFYQCNRLKDFKSCLEEAERIIGNISLTPRNDLIKVGLVGEIYLVMESWANHELEEKLAGLGAEVVRTQYISDWLTHTLRPPRELLRKTDRFLKYGIGGHEKENIGQIIHFKELGFDGVIHLLPFGCMPELVTQALIPALSSSLDLPILSLSLDEQTGWVNQQIRLEAFIDLLRSRKEEQKEALSWSGNTI